MIGPVEKRFVFWAVVAVVIVVVLRRIGIGSALAAKHQGAGAGAGASGFAGGGPATIFGTDPGTVTAPNVSPTPTTATQAFTGVDGLPVGTSLIAGTHYIGIPGSKPSDIQIAARKTDTSAGASVVSANVPGTTMTQGVSAADRDAFSAFHAQDSAVVAQQSIERNNVSAAQAGHGMFAGYRSDGSPLLVYQ